MWSYIAINLVIFIALLIGVKWYFNRNHTLSHSVFLALILGVLFGGALHLFYDSNAPVIKETLNWIGIVGSGYVRLLQMIVMPLVFVSILSAVARLQGASSLGKISVSVLSVLLITTAIAAVIGITMANLFDLSAEGLVAGDRELAAQDRVLGRAEKWLA